MIGTVCQEMTAPSWGNAWAIKIPLFKFKFKSLVLLCAAVSRVGTASEYGLGIGTRGRCTAARMQIAWDVDSVVVRLTLRAGRVCGLLKNVAKLLACALLHPMRED